MQAIERSGTIEVSAHRAEDDLIIQVCDNGPGIPPERIASIFDPYFTTKPEGNGLGLWIAQQIVTAHGGGVTAQNAPGKGAIFGIRLPFSARPSLN
jgi:signal transduction histidine kinase